MRKTHAPHDEVSIAQGLSVGLNRHSRNGAGRRPHAGPGGPMMQSAWTPRSKLPDVGTTIFTVIGQLAAEHDALNLSQGAPNFAPDPTLVEGVAAAMRDGHNQYAPMAGIGELRAALADKGDRLYGARYDASTEVTVAASASEGLYAAISALVHPGDEVVYSEPSFDSYAPIVRLQGATPVAIKLSPEHFRVNWDEVSA